MLIPPAVKRTAKYLVIVFGIMIIIVIVFVLYALGAFSSNKAQNSFKPLANALNQLGAKKLCSNGDNGKGIDNSAPWYEGYYSVSKTSHIEQQISSAAESMGYMLGPDSKAKSDQAGVPGYNNSIYLIGYHNGGELEVRIAYKGDEVPLYCGTGDSYGKSVSPKANEAIVDINLSLPEQA